METSNFIKIAPKLIKTGLFNVLEKGQHGHYLLGCSYLGRTELQNKKLWRKYGTLQNIIIGKEASEVNDILLKNGIVEFVAKPTKSKTMCRLIIAN